MEAVFAFVSSGEHEGDVVFVHDQAVSATKLDER